MQITLDYGKAGLRVETPDGASVLGLRTMPALERPAEALDAALRRPIGCAPLAELARGRRDACIAICDVTRPVPNALLLPPLLRTLEGAGIPRERITILVATGMHRPNEGAELEALVGPGIVGRYRVVNHDARDLGSHRCLGATFGGATAYVDERFCGAALKIVTGLVEPHFMAGFSGGRKVVCPGLIAAETARHFHATSILEHPLADTGVVEGNPVHAMALEVARLAGVDFAVNVTLDEERRLTGIFAGELERSWEAGVDLARRAATAEVGAPADIVVTSAAGYPLDTTYYQVVKGMVGALPIVKPGGTILLAARMSEGIGSPEFARMLLESKSLDVLMADIRRPERFVIDQWEVVMLAKALARAEVLCFTEGLDAETLRRLYVTPVPSVAEGIASALRCHGPNARIAIIPKGPYVMPCVRDARCGM